MESFFENMISSYLNISELHSFHNFRPIGHHTAGFVPSISFFGGKCGGPKTIGISKRFQRIFQAWNLDKY